MAASIWPDVWNALAHEWIVQIAVALILIIAGSLFTPVRRRIENLVKRVLEMWRAAGIVQRALRAVEGGGVWFSSAPRYPDNYHASMAQSIPILTLAALKGGVGKTTLAANLAAFFALDRNKRVLLIDLDFQGSLSSMLLPPAQRIPNGNHCRAAMAVGGLMSSDQFVALPVPLFELGNAKAIPAHYDLAQMENNRLIHWLLEHTEKDIRYTLAEYLVSDAVQSGFDLVIIDAPPRLTTAAVQSFCASTFVLIPTILDRLSGEAVSSFVGQLLDMKAALCPHLKILGVVGSMTRWNVGKWMEEHPESEPDGALTIAEREGNQAVVASLERLRIERSLPAVPARVLPYDSFVADSTAVAEQAGEQIAYPALPAAEKNMFRRLGREVSRIIFPGEL